MEGYATIQHEGAVKIPFMHTGVDESSLGAFLAAFFEEQAPMVQSDDSADVNRARDHARRRGHANRFLKICNCKGPRLQAGRDLRLRRKRFKCTDILTPS